MKRTPETKLCWGAVRTASAGSSQEFCMMSSLAVKLKDCEKSKPIGVLHGLMRQRLLREVARTAQSVLLATLRAS